MKNRQAHLQTDIVLLCIKDVFNVIFNKKFKCTCKIHKFNFLSLIQILYGRKWVISDSVDLTNKKHPFCVITGQRGS